MSRIMITLFIVMLAVSSQANAYAVCDRYKYGSQDWWNCMSSQGPANAQVGAGALIAGSARE